MSWVQDELDKLPGFKPEQHYLPTSHNRFEHVPNKGCKHCLREIVEAVSRQAPGEPTCPVCPRCYRVCGRSGKDKYGRQRWYCIRCGHKFSNRVPTPKQEQMKTGRKRALELLREGYSMRVATRMVGISMNSIKDKPSFLSCGCGRLSGHKGECYWRYERGVRKSKRDEALREMEL